MATTAVLPSEAAHALHAAAKDVAAALETFSNAQKALSLAVDDFETVVGSVALGAASTAFDDIAITVDEGSELTGDDLVQEVGELVDLVERVTTIHA